MAVQETLYPLEFFVTSTPLSLQASAKSKRRWKEAVAGAARERIRATDDLGFLDRRPLALTIYYFPAIPMQGDIDNIVKPIMDALIRVAFMRRPRCREGHSAEVRPVARLELHRFERDPHGRAG